MDISETLARILGLYFVVLGLYVISARKKFKQILMDYFSRPALVVFNAVFSLLFGLIIVVLQPVWELNYKGLITLIGLLGILRGLLHLFVPEKIYELSKKHVEGNVFLYLGVVIFLLGIFLSARGFFF